MYVKTEKETILLYCLLSDDAAPFYSCLGGAEEGKGSGAGWSDKHFQMISFCVKNRTQDMQEVRASPKS